MGKKSKRQRNSKDLYRGPWSADDISRALERYGYTRIPGRHKHLNYKHPTRPGKVQVSSSWEHVRAGDWIFNRIAENSGLGKKGLLRLLNGLDPDN